MRVQPHMDFLDFFQSTFQQVDSGVALHRVKLRQTEACKEQDHHQTTKIFSTLRIVSLFHLGI